QATLLGGGVTIAFARVEAATITVGGLGTLPLPPATSQAFTGGMHCAIARTDVLPAAATTGEHATTIALVSCAWTTPVPSPYDRYVDGSAVFGNGPGVRDVSGAMGPFDDSHQVRRVP
ncbi:MAG TPA: hypothetical protein VL400_04065, partial [Polyangiaceae bacterium]|nr:hypothetical protein [Polyangiaceae bacterium]